MNTVSRSCTLSALALGLALACASSAHAAAFQLKEKSAKGLGRAYAGSISAPGDAAVIPDNPAAMRHLGGRQMQADLSVISFSAKYSGRGDYLGGAGGPIGGGNGGDAGKVAPVPAAYFHMPFGEDDTFHFGASLHAPFGFGTKYDRNWMGRYNATKTDLQAIDLSAAFSYDVNPYFSVGATVFVEHLSIELQSAVDFGTLLFARGAGALGFAPGSHDGYSTIKGSNNELGYTVGGLFSFTDHTHLGLSYRSKVTHKIDDGDALFDVPAQAAAVLGAVAPGTFINTSGRANVSLPAVVTASFTHAFNERWSVMADISHTRWETAFDRVRVRYGSAQPDTVLDFNYQNTTFGSIGTEYKMSQSLTLRGGVAYDPTPTTYADRDVRVPDQTRKWLSLGLSWTPSEKTEYNFGYTHLFVNAPNVDSSNATLNRMRGSFDVNGDIFAVSMNYKF